MPDLWFEAALSPSGWASDVRIMIDHGTIRGVETGVPAQPTDERHGIAIPPLANVHSHSFQRGMAGLAERRGPTDDDFWTWREVMYRFLDHLTPDDIEAIAALAFAEMLEGGFGRVGEFHYLHHRPDGGQYDDVAETASRIAAAAVETGIALSLLPVFYAHGDFGGAAPHAGQRRFLSDLDGFDALFAATKAAIATLDAATIGVAPHSLRAVTPDELRHVAALCPDGPVHIHAAEQTKEVDGCLAWSGARPVEWLLREAQVDSRWCLIHATHLSPAEIAELAASGAVAGLCPITEANLGDGIFLASDYLMAGGRFGIGTDSNVQIDAAAELQSMEYAQRLSRRSRNVLASADRQSIGGSLYAGALAGGAQALGVPCPALSVGSPADIVALDARHPSLIERKGDAILDGWLFASRSDAVETVWRGGRKLVEQGQHVQRTMIRERYARTIRRLQALA